MLDLSYCFSFEGCADASATLLRMRAIDTGSDACNNLRTEWTNGIGLYVRKFARLWVHAYKSYSGDLPIVALRVSSHVARGVSTLPL